MGAMPIAAARKAAAEKHGPNLPDPGSGNRSPRPVLNGVRRHLPMSQSLD